MLEGAQIPARKREKHKKKVFEKIASSFNARSELKVSVGQCLRKWAKLEGKLKEITDHNKKKGKF